VKVVRVEGSRSSEPIDNIHWLLARSLKPNLYNPNVVFTPELKLLEYSLLSTGWIQPVIINTNKLIVDGFHRFKLSRDSQPIRDRWYEELPCVIFDINDAEAMMLTVRINRAKGTHVAVRMSDVIQELHNDLGVTVEGIMKGCGMDRDEVELLLAGSLLKTRKLDKYRYSNAWVPIETRREQVVAFEREEESSLTFLTVRSCPSIIKSIG